MFTIFHQKQDIDIFFSEKKHGPMRLKQPNNHQNRLKFLTKNQIPTNQCCFAQLSHSNLCRKVSGSSKVQFIKGDALLTKATNLFLFVTVSDCLPVFFYEPEQKIIAVAHAGWKGIYLGIIENCLQAIKKCNGRLKKTLVGIGPGIGSCHFEIKSDLAKKFKLYDQCIKKVDNRLYLNLKAVIKIKAFQAGVLSDNFENVDLCTFCHPERFFSFRRDQPKHVQPMLAGIVRYKPS
ncbi:MAG: hypothetical protein GF332_02535 [Candidatus Moranbacteria bacterium]|nr:hypothetical protein [Candidatus Moranbacteria bacterium]